MNPYFSAYLLQFNLFAILILSCKHKISIHMWTNIQFRTMNHIENLSNPAGNFLLALQCWFCCRWFSIALHGKLETEVFVHSNNEYCIRSLYRYEVEASCNGGSTVCADLTINADNREEREHRGQWQTTQRHKNSIEMVESFLKSGCIL